MTFSAAVLLLCVASDPVARPPADVARFTCVFRKKDDTFQVVTPRPGAEVFRIRSASGIGAATITCREGTWPETVTVLFAGMGNLEALAIEGNGVELSGQLGRGGPGVFYFDERGKPVPGAKGSSYRLTIEEAKGEGIRVTLAAPPTARRTKTWALNWIDAYRR